MKNETDSGRTLVEMLGVLAMAGVLSVMGVMGYRLAIDKNKANTLVNQAQQRAVIVMEQMTLNRPLSLQEFSSLNKTPAGTFGQATTQGLTKQFGIQVFGVEKRVCENILNMIGQNTPLRRLSHEASPTVAITQCGLSNDFLMVYNQEMKGAPEDTLYCTDDTDCSSENECMICEEESKSCQNKCQNLDYLESTGTQYIDTGLHPTDTWGYKIKNTYTKGQGEQCAIGTMDGDNRFVGTYVNNNEGVYVGWAGYLVFKPNWTNYGVFETECNYKNNRKIVLAGNGEVDISNYHIEGEIKSNLYLFARNYNGFITKMVGKIWSVQITNDHTLVRDFTPVLAPNGQPALFDQVEKKLYYNKGSGAFLYPEPTN